MITPQALLRRAKMAGFELSTRVSEDNELMVVLRLEGEQTVPNRRQQVCEKLLAQVPVSSKSQRWFDGGLSFDADGVLIEHYNLTGVTKEYFALVKTLTQPSVSKRRETEAEARRQAGLNRQFDEKVTEEVAEEPDVQAANQALAEAQAQVQSAAAKKHLLETTHQAEKEGLRQTFLYVVDDREL